MLSISLGPLALPVAPVILLLSVWVATSVAGRLAPADGRNRAENAVWLACLLGLLAARMGHVLINSAAYLTTPADMLDLRDGGWLAPVGWLAGALWLAWRAYRWPPARRGLGWAALAGAAVWSAASAVAALSSPNATNPVAPPVMLTEARTGLGRPLPDLVAGQVTVVNLWATWCGPCRVEMPTLAAAQQATPEVRFLFVNQGEPAATVATYLQRSGMTLRDVWLDPTSALGPAVGAGGLPTTLFFDASGQQVDAHFGILNAAALQAKLYKLQQAP